MKRVNEVNNSKIKMFVNLIVKNQEHIIVEKYVTSKQVDKKKLQCFAPKIF